MCVCAFMYVCAPACGCPRRPVKGVVSPAVASSLIWVLGMELWTSRRIKVLLTPKPSL